MIEIQVPNDVTKYKTKVLGPFTGRQLVIIIAVIFLDFFLYANIFAPMEMSAETLVYIAMAIDAPICLFMFEVYGLPMEKFIAQFFVCNVLAPTKRKYVGTLSREVDPPMSSEKINRIEKKRKKMQKMAKKDESLYAYD